MFFSFLSYQINPDTPVCILRYSPIAHPDRADRGPPWPHRNILPAVRVLSAPPPTILLTRADRPLLRPSLLLNPFGAVRPKGAFDHHRTSSTVSPLRRVAGYSDRRLQIRTHIPPTLRAGRTTPSPWAIG